MREAQTKEIGGSTYIVDLLAPKPGMALLIDLLKVAGPAFAEALGTGSAAGLLNAELGSEPMRAAVQALCVNVESAKVQSVIDRLANVTTILDAGKLSSIYDIHFARAGYLELMQWLAFAIKTQYADFFALSASVMPSSPRSLDQSPKA